MAPIVTALGALMSALAVVRHTRQNEETGRAELVGSAAVGRSAMLAAALVVAVGASVMLGILFATLLFANGLPLDGVLAAGATMAALGAVFGGVAAVTVQLAATARAASGLAISLLVTAYLLRGIGDLAGTPSVDGTTVTPAWPVWLSPFGWAEQVRPFAGPDWWPLAPAVVLFLIAVAVALVLAAGRDVGFGLIPASRGPASAARGLLSPLGLAWRQQRGLFAAWALGLAITSAVFGSLGQQVGAMAGNEQFRAILEQLTRGRGGDLADLFFGFAMGIIGLAASGYAVQALLELHTEEADGRLEPILGTAVSRLAWSGSHIACAVLGTSAILVIGGTSAGLVYGLVAADPGARLAELVPAALIQAPAVLVLAGIAVAAFGLLPTRAPAVSWAAVGAASFVTFFGDPLDLPDAVRNLSPFSHLPALPAEGISAGPILALLVISVALAGIGLVSFHFRDLAVHP
ncbi:MAG: hypothetical protein M0T75_08770 [Chloroflexi bacterium]|nr:hypothetical protein [Chloroflexota bacterium]